MLHSCIERHPCKLEVPLSPPLVAEAAAAAAAAASAILMAFLVLALAAVAPTVVVPEAFFTTDDAEAAGADSPSLESLESPPGRLARLLVDLHLLRQARLLNFPYHGARVSTSVNHLSLQGGPSDQVASFC